MKIFHFYLIIILIKIFSSQNKIYRIPFGLFTQENSAKDSNLINNIIFNGIYLNLSIGSPSQITPFELDSNSQTFSVSDYYFNRSKSITYEQLSEKEEYYAFEQVEKGFNSKDILNNNDAKKKINFILSMKYPNLKKNKLGILGLHIARNIKKGTYPFFRSLKEAELINSYSWTLKYFDNISLSDQITFNKDKDNIIGEFIFGDEPSNYENNKLKYNEKEFFKITPLSTKQDIDWCFEFDNIYLTYKENKNNTYKNYNFEKGVEIVINFSYMLSSHYFFSTLKSDFFSKYINDGVCEEKKVDYVFYYIECDYNSSFRVASFPDISFEHKGFQTIFNLTYKDLFIVDKKNNKYIFLILTKDYFSDWVLGSVFLRKYQFVFNNDLKTIGYYRQVQHYEDDNDNLKDLNKQKTVKTIIIFILIIIFSFLFVILGMIIQKKYFNKNRKLRANELEENFSYESKNNSENSLGINDDKKIINEYNDKSKYFSL